MENKILSNSIKAARNNAGSAYVMALITLVVAFVLGLALVEAVGSSSTQKKSTIDGGHAEQLADAGIHYGYWLYRHRQQTLPIENKTIELGSGTVSVSINNYSPIYDTVRIDSTGTVNGVSARKMRIVRKRFRPFEMGFAAKNDTTVTNDFYIETYGKKAIWVNGSLRLNAPGSVLYANGEVRTRSTTTGGSIGTQIAHCGRMYFPPIELEYYQEKANGATYDGSSSLDFTSLGPVVYVDNDLTINDDVTVTGKGVLVVNGKLNINADYILYSRSSDKLVVLTTGNITLESGDKTLDGFYYAHKGIPAAAFILSSSVGSATFQSGGVAADVVSLDGALTIFADPAFQNTDLGARMHLPGYDMGPI